MHQSVTEKYLFTKEWMEEFEKIWNSPENISSQFIFANSGDVLFVMDDDEAVIRSTSVLWEKDGKMSFVCQTGNADIIPGFVAPAGVWESVIYSYYSTIQAVVNKKMEFNGKMKFAISFSQRFTMIADVAILVNRMFMQR